MNDKSQDTEHLQQLVDDHARIGWNSWQIRDHLRKEHGIAKNVLIPPPTRSADADRSYLLRTGDMSRARKGGRMVVLDRSDGGGSDEPIPPRDPNRPFFHELDAEGQRARMAEALASVKERFGVTLTADFHSSNDELTPDEGKESFFEEMYCGAGPTLIDRLIQGGGRLLNRAGDSSLTRFDAFATQLQRRMLAASRDSTLLNDPMRFLDRAIAPWFHHDIVTDNVQIDQGLAEVFLASRKPMSDSWKTSLCQRPFFVDLQPGAVGERYLSGIFCQPSHDGTSFVYMAVVEWAGQGYESFLFGENSVNDLEIFRVAADEIPPAAVDVLYAPIRDQIVKVLSMARLHFDNVSASQRRESLLRVMTPEEGEIRTSEKKARNKEKTHSYFRVVRLTTPPDRFGRARQTKSSWSLDHVISVSGHYRWQPHGEGRRMHKLIWIESFDKGVGGRHRPASDPILIDTTGTIH